MNARLNQRDETLVLRAMDKKPFKADTVLSSLVVSKLASQLTYGLAMQYQREYCKQRSPTMHRA